MAYHISKVSPTLLYFNQYRHYLTRYNVVSIVSSDQIGSTYYWILLYLPIPVAPGQIHSGCILTKE